MVVNAQTEGVGAPGLLAQSIGGGGGLAYSTGAVTIDGGNSGANGGTVSVTTGGWIETYAAASPGLLAQSIGGGGGLVLLPDAPITSFAVSYGVGNASTVTVAMNKPQALTIGAGSVGVLLQSIGGGGGAVISSYNDASKSNFNVATAISSNGSNGGPVSLDLGYSSKQSVNVQTDGANAPAVVLQSIGGNGGLFTSANAAPAGSMTADFWLASTGNQTFSSTATLNAGSSSASGLIATNGVNSPAVVAQSIADDGGFMAFANGAVSSAVNGTVEGRLGVSGNNPQNFNSSDVSVSFAGLTVATTNLASPGIVAQSISGGGGISALTASENTASNSNAFTTSSSGFVLGASSGKEENAGSVTVTTSGGAVSTTGQLSPALVAQSIGNGGGLALLRASWVGVAGGTSGYGGDVAVTNGSKITTAGAGSVGIVAQSIGGGGGLAYSTSGIGMGGSSGTQKAGSGIVTVTSNGAITTSGTNAIGILAQSVSSGGGAVLSTGDAITAQTFYKPANSSNANAVTVNVNAPITTTGAGGYGVIAQSVAGGGGLIMNGTTAVLKSAGGGGSSGKVTVNANASITVSGAGAAAIKTQSTSDPEINVASGVAVTGGQGGMAIDTDGPQNVINNAGTLSTVDGANGLAIRSTGGATQVANAGTLLGDLSLSAGAANTVDNLAGGTILAGNSLDLGGAGGTLRNAGALGSAAAQPSGIAINGNLVQSATGVLLARADQMTGTTDTLSVTGQAQLGGAIIGELVSSHALARPGSFTTPLVTALGGLSLSDLTVGGNTAILRYTLTPSAKVLALTTTLDFTPEGLTKAGEAIGARIGQIQTNGSSSLFQTIMPELLDIPSVGSLDQAYNTVGGGAVSMVPQAMFSAASVALTPIVNQMDLWRTGAAVAADPSHVVAAAPSDGIHSGRNTPVFWTTPTGDWTTGSVSGSTVGTSVGIEGNVPNLPILLGFAGNFSGTSLSASNYSASTSTDYGGGSFYGIYAPGRAYVSAITTLGYGSSTYDRNLYPLAPSLSASVDIPGTMFGGRIETGYDFTLPHPRLTLTPFLAFQPLALWQGSARDSLGSSGEGLTYDATTLTALPTYLGLRLERAWTDRASRQYGLVLRASWMHDFSPNRDVPRSFSELPDMPFAGSAIPTVSNAADLHAGFEFGLGANLSFTAAFDSQLAPSYSTLGGSGTLTVKW